jgi:lysozyme
VAQESLKKIVHVPLTDKQYEALVSLMFNVGQKHLENSKLINALNKGNYEEAATHFTDYIFYHLHDKNGKPRGSALVSRGLLNRRRDEQKLFQSSSKKELAPHINP